MLGDGCVLLSCLVSYYWLDLKMFDVISSLLCRVLVVMMATAVLLVLL